MATRVLAIGDGAEGFASQLYDGAEVETADLKPGKGQSDYDAIVSFNVLPRLSYRKVVAVSKEWVAALKKGGEFVLMFPSLEWAAEQILAMEASPAVIAHLFGLQMSPKQYYQSAYTMMDGRALCADIGVKVTHAATGLYTIGEYDCELHTIRGIK